MSSLDRLFATMRADALRAPKTRADGEIVPAELPGGVYVGLSVNL
jgi:hypothetical protein